jgi:hypothetical protein
MRAPAVNSQSILIAAVFAAAVTARVPVPLLASLIMPHGFRSGVPVAAIAGASVMLNLLTIGRHVQRRRSCAEHGTRKVALVSDRIGDTRNAEPGGVELLDRALRSLAFPRRSITIPPITGAVLTGTGVELCLAKPAEPLPPFFAVGELNWRLDTASEALLQPDLLGEVTPPFPTLVIIGDDASGSHVLVDLAQAGVIGLHGTQEQAREVLTALAMEMATSPWAGLMIIHCAGFGADLAGDGRLRYWPDLDQCLAGMREFAADAETQMVILSLDPPSSVQLGVIGELAYSGFNIAAVIAPAGGEVPLPGPWQLDVTPGRLVRLPVLGREVILQRVTVGQDSQLAADLDPTTNEAGAEILDWAGAAEGPDLGQPGQKTSSLGTAGTSARSDSAREREAGPELVVRVLGSVEVGGRDAGTIESGKRNLLPELAAYLRLHPGRTAEEVSRAMGGPRGPWAAATRTSNMSRLRAWLGRDEQGRHYVPALGEGRLYALLGSVRCDWDEFRELARRGLGRGDGVEDLLAALELVRGQPFSGAGSHSYVWAEFIKQEMISAIVDVAHAVAVRLTERGDPAGARAAIARGLGVEPGSELLYRDLFLAEQRAGNAAGIEEAAERLMVTLGELGLDMELETVELLNQVRGRRVSVVGRR